MATIPKKVFETVEGKLFGMNRLISDAITHRNAVAEQVLHGTPARDPRAEPAHTNAINKETEVKAIKLVEASEEVTKARIWVFEIEKAYEYFIGTTTADVAEAFYIERKDRLSIANAMRVSTKTIDRERDRFVSTVALYAAARGLIALPVIRGEGVVADDAPNDWQHDPRDPHSRCPCD